MRIAATLVTCATLASFVCAQEAQSKPTSRPDLGTLITAWRNAPPGNVSARAALIEEVIERGRPGTARLAKLIRRRVDSADLGRQERESIEFVLRDLSVDYLQHVAGSGMHFAGQFDPLSPLQPWIGKMYCRLIIETPPWFPDTMRLSVVPALRDLFPKGPEKGVLDQLETIASDVEGEQGNLREALAYAFAQWGDRSFVQPTLDEFKAAAGDASDIDSLYFVRRLAHAHNQMRDYREAAQHWTRYLRGMEELKSSPLVLDYYNAACVLSLLGNVPAAFEELERCSARMLSDEIDESERVERSLFDNDPELRALRSTPRFKRIVEKTFGTKSG